jgi:hypothetical protein
MLRVFALLLLLCLPARGQTFTAVPYSFVGGTLANAAQVMADFNALVTQGNAVAAHINSQLSSLGLPATGGTLLIYFYLPSCPSGWTSVAAANSGNYFVRGLDLGAFNDPTGSELQLGRIETATIVNHQHTQSALVSGYNTYPFSFGSQALLAATNVIQVSNVQTGIPNSGQHGATTYPKNVSLILCSKN